MTKYRLSGGKVVRSIYGERERIVETLPGRFDRLAALFRFPYANVVALGLTTASAAAFVVAVWLEQGWDGAGRAALLAPVLFFVFAFVGSYFATGVFASEQDERQNLWRVLVPWAILAIVVTALVASERPWL